jgi:tRNA splicing endonuclease
VHTALREHDHNFVLGPGDVYGGDYTLYKDGDPSSTHSIATVRIHSQSMVSVKDILAYSRVQNQVAKAAVYAFPSSSRDDRDGEVRFVAFNFRAVATR